MHEHDCVGAIQALTKLRAFKSQELANGLWAIAVLKTVCPMEDFAPQFASDWAQASMSTLSGGPTVQLQHMANTVWAFAQLRLDPLEGRYCTLHLLKDGACFDASPSLPGMASVRQHGNLAAPSAIMLWLLRLVQRHMIEDAGTVMPVAMGTNTHGPHAHQPFCQLAFLSAQTWHL